MNRNIPKFMTEKREIVQFLAFVIFWIGIFMLVYHPDVSIRGFEHKDHQYRYYLSILISIGYIILILSRFGFYKINKVKPVKIKFLYWWIIQEIILISAVLSFVSWNINVPNTRPFLTILPRTIISVVSILIIPYIISYLYFSLEEKKKIIKDITEKRKVALDKGVINFNDEKGVFRLSVRLDDFIYAQSADNYVFIYYLNSKKEVVKFMLRNTLKYVEESFQDMNFIRCHRFYVVNLGKVRILKKGKDGLIIELDTEPHTEIPVSKTYAQTIADLFTQNE